MLGRVAKRCSERKGTLVRSWGHPKTGKVSTSSSHRAVPYQRHGPVAGTEKRHPIPGLDRGQTITMASEKLTAALGRKQGMITPMLQTGTYC